ncbi:phage integrase SAM-like domain-containing protein [Polaribacter litorisediminis]|uniref:phage integrase SAM-like domain-containing protein n=1 Tax=Polaribacter litorisediminis TaxID=1908341 RepID=UPI001CBB951E|nr:phage integrase SAM-like domain-containing protein [Polaribacter litorisediminis]
MTFKDVDKNFVQNFRNYFDKDAIARAGKKLSQNSKHSCFGKFMSSLKQAIKDDILKNKSWSKCKAF